jgi:membrane protein
VVADLNDFRYLRSRSFWRSVWRDLNQEDYWGLAAQLSYYFLLAFVPFLIFLIAMVGFISVEPELQQRILTGVERVLPDSAFRLVRSIVVALIDSRSGGVLSLGLVLMLWSASRAFSGMVGVLNRAYVVKDRRSFFRIQLLALGVTVLFSIFVVFSTFLLFFGDLMFKVVDSAGLLVSYSSFRYCVGVLYWAVRWLLIFTLLNVGIQIAYFTLPARRLPWRFFSPGSLVATLGWVLASKGFAWYTKSVADYQRIYGSLGALIVLMIWFYLSSLFLLLGGEINSEIYRLRHRDEPPRHT